MRNIDSDRSAIVRLALFAHNRKDAAIVRRAQSFLDAGVDLTGFMFRRDGEPNEPGPEWCNIDLGMVVHCKHLQRLLTLSLALWRTFQNRSLLRNVDIVYARNLDLLILSFIGLLFARTREPKIVYEVLDVHVVLTRPNFAGRLLRWVERLALKHIDMLVVSSPAYIREYFTPVQNYGGAHFLIENKLYFRGRAMERPTLETIQKPENGPLVLGWVGIQRCQRTLDLMKQVAEAEGENIQIRIHGKISRFIIPDFEDQIAEFPNIVYEGSYEWPEGLAYAYRRMHLVYVQGLHQSSNYNWALTNRSYEGGFFGVLSLGVTDTETGRTILERDWGYAVDDTSGQTLIDFLRKLDLKEVLDKQRTLLKQPQSNFVANTDEVKQFVAHVLSEEIIR